MGTSRTRRREPDPALRHFGVNPNGEHECLHAKAQRRSRVDHQHAAAQLRSGRGRTHVTGDVAWPVRPGRCDRYDPCKRDYDSHKGSYDKKGSAKLIDLKLRVKLLEKQKKDWGKSKYYKDKPRDHEHEARKCRRNANKYHKAADYERERAEDHLLYLKLRLAL